MNNIAIVAKNYSLPLFSCNPFLCYQDQSDEAELIEVSPTVMFTNSPSGEASVSPGVITSDEPDEGIIEEDNDDTGRIAQA